LTIAVFPNRPPKRAIFPTPCSAPPFPSLPILSKPSPPQFTFRAHSSNSRPPGTGHTKPLATTVHLASPFFFALNPPRPFHNSFPPPLQNRRQGYFGLSFVGAFHDYAPRFPKTFFPPPKFRVQPFDLFSLFPFSPCFFCFFSVGSAPRKNVPRALWGSVWAVPHFPPLFFSPPRDNP